MKTLLFLLSLGLATQGFAEENTSPEKPVDIYGFVTQGYFKSNHNSFYGPSSSGRGSFEFTELGLGAHAILGDRVHASGLLLARKAGDVDDGNVRVDHLLLDINLNRSASSSLDVSLGRNKIPFGFYNATRDVSITRPTLLLPQSVYFDHSRNTITNADGMDLRYSWWKDDNYFRVNFLYEKMLNTNLPNMEDYYLAANWPGDLKNSTQTGLVFNADLNGGKTKFAAFLSTDRNKPTRYVPGAFDPLGAGEIDTETMWLSVQHEIIDGVRLTSEAFLPRIRYRNFGPFIPDRDVYPVGYYFQATWEIAPRVETYLRFDQTYKDRDDKKGIKWNAATGQPAHRAFASDWTIGVNWFPTKDVMLSAEFHRVDGTAFLPRVENEDLSLTSRKWNLLGLQATYNFR